MKRPTWATIVGVLGIIFACGGILSAGQDIFMPKMLEMQKTMLKEFEADSANNNGPPHKAFKHMQEMLNFPEWFVTWSVFSGVAKALISSFFLLASIWILLLKPISIRLFYLAAGLNIFYAIVKGIILINFLEFWGAAMMMGGVFSSLVSFILIIVVSSADKSAFQLVNTKK